MKSAFYHLQININTKNLSFYNDIMKFLGWIIIFENEEMAGYRSEKNGDLWFIGAQKQQITDYDGYGVNHIGLRVENQSDVDEVVTYLKQHRVEPLFETPKHRPDFASEPDETYYQVMFESPDKILFEVVYVGPKVE
jgi:catechol 2,3-dioxygenase-like lactoylglutathione lyase family enzyme